jgi:hypothetical protein
MFSKFVNLLTKIVPDEGRAVIEVVSLPPPTAAVLVRARVNSYGICAEKMTRFSASTSVSPASQSND